MFSYLINIFNLEQNIYELEGTFKSSIKTILLLVSIPSNYVLTHLNKQILFINFFVSITNWKKITSKHCY